MANMTPLADQAANCAFAFRGYNTENLGRTAELLAAPRYRDVIAKRLAEASTICGEVLGRSVDLEQRVVRGEEACLDDYAESVALVFAAELAQIELLEQVHGISMQQARMAYGYSLGELVALVASSRVAVDEVLRVPLAMAPDCAELAHDVTMGVLFSRGPAIDERLVLEVCEKLTAEGQGVIGVSAILSPNTYLVLGQGDTIRRLRKGLGDFFPYRVHLRKNDSLWPPLHTPIVWQRNVPDRASVLMQTMTINEAEPSPPIFSLVTGRTMGEEQSIRATLRDWVDQPQRLWDAVCGTLAADVTTVIHVGPAPNVIPATFRRLSDNVRQATAGTNLAAWGRFAASHAQRTWLAALLPRSAALLRAPRIHHVVLEDWLIEHA